MPILMIPTSPSPELVTQAAIAANAEALAKARTGVADTEEMKALSAVGANQTVNAATVVSAGGQMFAAMGDSFSEKLAGTGIDPDGLALLGSTQVRHPHPHSPHLILIVLTYPHLLVT